MPQAVAASPPVILAHRAYRDGHDPERENKLDAVKECLRYGWGVEIDIRRSPDGRLYISHDPADPVDRNDARLFCQTIQELARSPVALNVKEVGYEGELVGLLAAYQIMQKVFLFDMELIEDNPGETAKLFRRLHAEVQVAVRVSDRGEPVTRALQPGMPDIVWLDEFDRLWATRDDIRRLQRAGKRIYAISPEIHGFPEAQMIQRWQEFLQWGLDGICTDYPSRLQAYATSTMEAMRA